MAVMNDLEYMLHLLDQFALIENIGLLDKGNTPLFRLWDLEYTFYQEQLDSAMLRILGLNAQEREQLTLVDVRDLTMQRLTQKGKTPVTNDVLREHFRSFLVKFVDAEYPLRRIWDEARKTDFMLEDSWFSTVSGALLERELVKDWDVLTALQTVIKYAVWNNLQKHPFVQECIRIHQIFFKELSGA